MYSLLTLLAVGAYAAAVVRLALGLRHPPPPRGTAQTATDPGRAATRRITLLLAALALVLHSLLTYRMALQPEGLVLPFFVAMSLISVVIVLLHLLLCLREAADYLGIAIYPLAATSLVVAELRHNAGVPVEVAIRWHVLLSVLAYAVLALAALQAVLVAVQRHQLSHHHPGGFMRALPPFERTESLMFLLLGFGFVLLTLSLGTGFIELDNMFAQHLAHKTVLSSLAWVVFAALLYGRWRYGLSGRRAVNGVIGGVAVLVLAYFGSKLVLELVLGRTG